MTKSLKSRAVLSLIKQFLPDIKDQAAPMLENVLTGIIQETENDLRLGEEYVAITVVRQYGKVYLCVNTMSEHNQWMRTVERCTVEELVNKCITKFLEKESAL